MDVKWTYGHSDQDAFPLRDKLHVHAQVLDSATGSYNCHITLWWHWRPLLTTVLACISKLAKDSFL